VKKSKGSAEFFQISPTKKTNKEKLQAKKLQRKNIHAQQKGG